MYDDCRYLNHAIKKYGWKKFKIEVLKRNIPLNQLNEYEINFIKLYKTFGTGYNLTLGGGGLRGHKWSKEQREKFMNTAKIKRDRGEWKSNKGKPSRNKGKKMSEEQKIKLRNLWTVERRKAQGEKMKKLARNGGITDKQRKALELGPKRKKIEVYKDGIRFEFPSIVDASKKLNLPHSFISKRCRGVYQQCKKYTFHYIN